MYRPQDLARVEAFDAEQLEALSAHYTHHYPDLLLWAAGSAVDCEFRGARTIAHDLAGTYALKQFNLSMERAATAHEVYDPAPDMNRVDERISTWSPAELLGRQVARFSLGVLASRWYSLDAEDIGRAESHAGTRSVLHQNLVDAVTNAPRREGFTDIVTATFFQDIIDDISARAAATGSLHAASTQVVEPTMKELLELAGPFAERFKVTAYGGRR